MNSPLSDQAINAILNRLRLESDFVLLETSKTTVEEQHSLLFTSPRATLSFYAGESPAGFLASIQQYLTQGYYVAGWFAYEFGYALEPVLHPLLNQTGDVPLARLGVYDAPQIFKQSYGALPLPDDGIRPDPEDSYRISDPMPDIIRDQYLQALARIKEYITAGDTYQVNYTLKLLFEFSGSPEALYLALRRNQPVSYGAYLHLGEERILSFSPELFFRKHGRECRVKPMKGTMARGRTPEEDRRLAASLRNDPKNRSENVMIVDLLRNDLGRLSAWGEVAVDELFTVETYATVHQLTSSIHGRIGDHVGLEELFKALFPCGSVTGAPKIRTMEIIRELEVGARGVYTGAIGYLAPNGDGVFNVPIRTVLLRNGRGEMGIGSGVVHDSDPEAEWRECLLKGRFLTQPRPDFQLIETILWQQGSGFWLLDLHLNRLTQSARYFDYPADREAITDRLHHEARTWQTDTVRARLLLYRDGRVVIEHSPCAAPACTDLPVPEETGSPDSGPFTVILSAESTDSSSPFLYHKTTLRDLYAQKRQQALARGAFEILFTNKRGEVSEGSISNVLIRRGNRFLTPPLEAGLLPGVFREYLLARHPGTVSEATLYPDDLRSADAVYLINSVRGAVRVRLDPTSPC